jgi:hypothetical protein
MVFPIKKKKERDLIYNLEPSISVACYFLKARIRIAIEFRIVAISIKLI